MTRLLTYGLINPSEVNRTTRDTRKCVGDARNIPTRESYRGKAVMTEKESTTLPASAPVEYWHDAYGGFAAIVPGTNLAAYAYPSSEYAMRAKYARHSESTARAMLSADLWGLASFVESPRLGYARLVERAEHIRASRPLAVAA